jgi:uncharacterized protein with FMN-binding domain
VLPKRGAIALGLTGIALVLLISFRTPTDAAPVAGTATIDGGGTGQVGTTGGSSGSAGTTGSSGTTGSTGSADTSAQAGTRVVDGPVVDTRYGPVQVEVTLDGSTITAIAAIQLPGGDRRSEQISNRAEPTLQSEALQAQSANIDGVSGATYTSEGYARSLQAALDDAGI